ncbi:MAG TPA: hypothetical protein VML19_22640 [Verrucomicrobiae bacterium]|nr:hypothetical protein [Verrucomicrobiae bacterium]
MADSPVPFTHEEHRELGLELRQTETRLRELRDVVLAVYGEHNRASFSFQRVLESMTRLRADLQIQMGRDYPGYGADGTYL